MKSDRLMRRLVQGSAALTLLLLVQSALGFADLPRGAGWLEILLHLRADQLVLVALFTLQLSRIAAEWKTGSSKGLMLVQIYSALLLLLCFQHFGLWRRGGPLWDFALSGALGALALAGMVTYYVKYRESRGGMDGEGNER